MKQTQIGKNKIQITNYGKTENFDKFAEDFFETIRLEIGHNDFFEAGDGVIDGVLLDTCTYTGDEDDTVAIPISDEAGNDGGYIHVQGWIE